MISIPASSNKKATFHLLTFGCQMNVNDSQWLTARLRDIGFCEAPLCEATFVLLNTCSVREKPEQKVASAIRRALEASKGQCRIAVLGCVAQQLGKGLFEISPNIDLVAGSDAISAIPASLAQLLAEPEQKLALLDFSKEYQERPLASQTYKNRSAFVTIMQGCDNFCAYCIVPFTRGRQKSRPAAAIIAECRNLLANGVIEITLLGQNVNAWGDENGASFASLVREICSLDGLLRLRFITSHPKDFAEDCISLFELPQVCPSLHLPLQAGSDRVLDAMRRRYNSADYLDLVNRLRAIRPDLALATDLITGFPSESEADFQETLTMMEACAFATSYSFCYSDRPFTRAALMPDKIPPEEKLARLARLQQLQDKLTNLWLTQRIGQKAQILLEGPSPRGPVNSWEGRDIYGAKVHIQMPDGDHHGRLINALITEAKKHCLLGTSTES